MLFPVLCISYMISACSRGIAGGNDYTRAEVEDSEKPEVLSSPESLSESDSVSHTAELPETGNLSSKAEEAKTQSKDTGNEETGNPEISYEILREVLVDGSGRELACVQYPVFTLDSRGYESLSAALVSINEEWHMQSEKLLDEIREWVNEYGILDGSVTLGQEIQVTISRCDAEVICILVLRSVEEGGPHPNHYITVHNLNAVTGNQWMLSDVLTVDDELKKRVKAQLYENYPELDFDDASMEQEISDKIDNERIDWYFWENQICISFETGSFGFGHAEGSLGVIISDPYQGEAGGIQ